MSLATAGAVKVAFAVPAPLSATDGPEVCAHAYVEITPSESEEPMPESSTSSPAVAVWSAPAFATGGWLSASGRTVTSTTSLPVAF